MKKKSAKKADIKPRASAQTLHSTDDHPTSYDELLLLVADLGQARNYAEGILESLPVPLIVLDAQTRILTSNHAFHEFFQISKKDTTGKSMHALAEKRWKVPSLANYIRDVFSGRVSPGTLSIDHDFPSVGKRSIVVHIHPLSRAVLDKQLVFILCFEDITRHKQTELSLEETQKQLKLALSAGSVGTWAWNIKRDEVRTDGEEDSLYGFAEGHKLKRFAEWAALIHPLDRQRIHDAVQASIALRKPLDIEFRISWPNGSTHWILAKANTYFDADGNPDKLVGVNIDITERRRDFEALAESEKRFHTMSDSAPVMIWMAGPDRETNFLNKTWLSFTGRTMEEEEGQGWFSGIHPDDKAGFVETFHHSFEKIEEFRTDFRLKRHDGEYRWMMAHGVPRFAGDNRFIGFIGTCADITDRIDLEKQKDDFMSIASHELKTPVTSIKAYAQILEEKFRKENDPVAAGMLSRLDFQIDKLTALIKTLLDVAKVQSGQMDYFEEIFDIRTFIQEVAEEMQRTSPRHMIVTDLKTEGKVYGDRSRLAQVLTNLISNAVKYSPEGEQVILSAERSEDYYIFSVKDSGIGIPGDMQEKIFARFFRASESADSRVSGLGLGLFIASQIVKQQGGKLWVESEPGRGSVFYFSVPVKDSEL